MPYARRGEGIGDSGFARIHLPFPPLAPATQAIEDSVIGNWSSFYSQRHFFFSGGGGGGGGEGNLDH